MAAYLRFLECAAADVPTPPAGTVSFFLNSADGTPSFKDETGAVTPITSADPELAAIAGLTSAANKGIIFTGSGTAAVFDLSAAALTVLDDGTVAAMVDTLGGAASTGTGGLVRATGPTIVGATFSADITVPDDAYDATTWNGSTEVPTKNALRDKIETLAGIAGTIVVRKNSGADVGTRGRLNLIEGSNVTLTVTDDAGDGEIDVTIASTGAGGGSAGGLSVPFHFGMI